MNIKIFRNIHVKVVHYDNLRPAFTTEQKNCISPQNKEIRTYVCRVGSHADLSITQDL